MPSEFRRILMTGGTGFVGRHLCSTLAERFPEATRVATARFANDAAVNGWEVVALDIVEATAVDRVVQALKPDLVVHLAAQASVVGGNQETWRSNFLGSFTLACAINEFAPRACVLFASSAEVYGASLKDGPAREDTPLRPMNAYSRSKAAAEQMLADVLSKDVRLIVARPFNHTGPLQSETFVLPSIAAQIARIEKGLAPPRLMVGNLDAERDFLDVRDVVTAYADLLSAASGLPDRVTVNIGSGSSIAIGYLLELFTSRSRLAFEVVQDPERLRPSEIPRASADVTRLRSLTGWRPRHPVGDTVDSLLAHWRSVYEQPTQ